MAVKIHRIAETYMPLSMVLARRVLSCHVLVQLFRIGPPLFPGHANMRGERKHISGDQVRRILLKRVCPGGVRVPWFGKGR